MYEEKSAIHRKGLTLRLSLKAKRFKILLCDKKCVSHRKRQEAIFCKYFTHWHSTNFYIFNDHFFISLRCLSLFCDKKWKKKKWCQTIWMTLESNIAIKCIWWHGARIKWKCYYLLVFKIFGISPWPSLVLLMHIDETVVFFFLLFYSSTTMVGSRPDPMVDH